MCGDDEQVMNARATAASGRPRVRVRYAPRPRRLVDHHDRCSVDRRLFDAVGIRRSTCDVATNAPVEERSLVKQPYRRRTATSAGSAERHSADGSEAT